MLPQDGVKVFQGIMHAHLLSRGITLRQIRNNRELPIVLQGNSCMANSSIWINLHFIFYLINKYSSIDYGSWVVYTYQWVMKIIKNELSFFLSNSLKEVHSRARPYTKLQEIHQTPPCSAYCVQLLYFENFLIFETIALPGKCSSKFIFFSRIRTKLSESTESELPESRGQNTYTCPSYKI